MFTPNYLLIYLDDTYHKYVSAVNDRRNWMFVDNQIHGLLELVGNGAELGWMVTEDSGLDVAISVGSGVVDGYFAETTEDAALTLEPNATNYVYATPNDGTPTTGDVSFTSDLLGSSETSLLLAEVVTDSTSIVSIDNTVRGVIGWSAALEYYLLNHVHDGDPISQIDLSSHVTGLLSSDNIESIDASKITGALTAANIPQFSHTVLEDIGRYTHDNIDDLIDELVDDRYREFGNVVAHIIGQDVLAKGHIYYDPVDPEGYFRFFKNLIMVIPGITARQSGDDTPNYTDLLDYTLTTAEIDETNRVFYSGLATVLETPKKFSKTWSETTWDEIVSSDDVSIDDTITLEVLTETTTYASSGTAVFTYDTGRVSDFGTVSWSVDAKSMSNTVSVKTRSAATLSGLTQAAWSSAITVSGTEISSGNNRYIQLEVTLATTDTSKSPELDWVQIEYEAITTGCGRALWPVFEDWDAGTLTDVVVTDDVVTLDTGGAGTYESGGEAVSTAVYVPDNWQAWVGMTWDSVLPTGGTLSVYYRTADTEVDLASATWLGPYTDGDSGVDLSSADVFLQLKIVFATTDTAVTPTFDLINLDYQEINL